MKLNAMQAGQLMQLAGMLGQSVAGPDRRQQALLAQLMEMGQGVVQNEVVKQEAKKQKKAAKKERTSNILGTIGSVVGAAVGGPFAPITAAIGGSLGRAAGGGEVGVDTVVQDAVPSLMQGVAAKAAGSAAASAAPKAVEGTLDQMLLGESINQVQVPGGAVAPAAVAAQASPPARSAFLGRVADQFSAHAAYGGYGMGGLMGGAIQELGGSTGGAIQSMGGLTGGAIQDLGEMVDPATGRRFRARRVPYGGY